MKSSKHSSLGLIHRPPSKVPNRLEPSQPPLQLQPDWQGEGQSERQGQLANRVFVRGAATLKNWRWLLSPSADELKVFDAGGASDTCEPVDVADATALSHQTTRSTSSFDESARLSVEDAFREGRVAALASVVKPESRLTMAGADETGYSDAPGKESLA